MKQRVIELLRTFGSFIKNFILRFWAERFLPWIKGMTVKKALLIVFYCGIASVLLVVLLFFILSFGLPTVESLKDYKPSPELVAVAGEYVVNERLKKSVINQSVLISLREGRLRFEVIGSFSPR